MRTYLILFALLAAMAGYANDHRVCVYRGHILATEQPATSARAFRLTQRAWMVVDWPPTEADLGDGWQTQVRVSIVVPEVSGGVTRVDYATDADAAHPAFALVPQHGNSRGILAVEQSELGWQALMLQGLVHKLTLSGAAWSVPLRLRGRGLAYTAGNIPGAANARYTFLLDRSLTLLTASIADATVAFDTAVANAEAAARRGP